MEKATITSIEHSNANAQGIPYLDDQSRPKTRVIVTTKERGSKKVSGFFYKDSPVLSWRVGGEYEVEVKPSKDGKYLNFWPARTEKDIEKIKEDKKFGPRQEGFTSEHDKMLREIHAWVVGAREEQELS